MHKVLLIVCLPLLCVCMPLSAQETGGASGGGAKTYRSCINLWGGYTTVDMSDVNSNLSDLTGRFGSTTKIDNGYSIAGDFLYEVWPRWLGGVRLEYVGVNQGKATNILAEFKQDLYLIPIMLGGRYYLTPREKPWSLSAGLFAGVGLGYGQTSAGGITTKYDGSGFAADALIGAEYKLSNAVSIGLDLGYRFADISQMNTSSTSSGGNGGGGGGYSIRKAVVTKASGSTLKYDFSGLIANIGLLFRY